MGSQGLTEDEDKALRKIVQRKVEEKRAGAAVAAAVSAVTKEVTGWRCEARALAARGR